MIEGEARLIQMTGQSVSVLRSGSGWERGLRESQKDRNESSRDLEGVVIAYLFPRLARDPCQATKHCKHPKTNLDSVEV